MPDSFTPDGAAKSAAAMPAVPPSTSEIIIRTMASDIELMGKAGGMTGQGVPIMPAAGETIRTTSFAPPPQAPAPDPGEAARRQGKKITEMVIWTGIVVIVAGVLFAVGFYLIPAMLKK